MVKKRSASLRRIATERDRTTADVTEIVDASRRIAARSVNATMIAAYWAIGRRLAEQELREGEPAPVPDAHLAMIAAELTARFGRGYTVRSLRVMRAFYGAYRSVRPVMRVLDRPPPRNYLDELSAVAAAFSLSWSHYVELVKVVDGNARGFYECEALRHGWTVRQLALQIRSGLYERVRPPRDLDALRREAAAAEAAAAEAARLAPLPDEALRDPYLRRFFSLPPRAGTSKARDGRFIWISQPQVWLQ